MARRLQHLTVRVEITGLMDRYLCSLDEARWSRRSAPPLPSSVTGVPSRQR